ncbi:MAG: hypothetical protein LUG52_03155, partial [Clostridia bacterium]|nr:hypothetical protein [Clostridia bacterium]
MKTARKIFALMLTLTLILGTMVLPSYAATKWPATSGIKTYCLSTSNNTVVYQTTTSTAKYGTIYATDLVTIKGYDSSSDRFKVNYPISGGTKTGYVKRTAITSGKVNSASGTFTATAKITTYRRASTSNSLGSISKGDECYQTATSGSYTQVIYPISGGYKMGWIKTSSIPTPGSSSGGTSLPTNIYLQQEGTTTCTLASATMMLRARKYLSGKDYSSITESAVESTAWAGSSGLKWNWTYSGITVTHSSVSGISASSLKSLLDKHPEGIVLYCGNYPHAVFLTRYSGDTFYCADPLSGYSGKELKLKSSKLGAVYGSQSKVLKNVTAYWYV